MPGGSRPPPTHALARLSLDILTLAAPIVLLAAAVGLVALCVVDRTGRAGRHRQVLVSSAARDVSESSADSQASYTRQSGQARQGWRWLAASR
jgi:hypothetical protein